MTRLGALLLAEQDLAEARCWFEKAAEHGQPDAMFSLGVLLKDRDPAEARRWFEKAAEQGHISAMNNLGALLADQRPGRKPAAGMRRPPSTTTPRRCSTSGCCSQTSDPAEARRWYEKAAEHSHARRDGQPRCAARRQDPAEARRWYEKAAEHSHPGAMNNLRRMSTATWRVGRIWARRLAEESRRRAGR